MSIILKQIVAYIFRLYALQSYLSCSMDDLKNAKIGVNHRASVKN